MGESVFQLKFNRNRVILQRTAIAARARSPAGCSARVRARAIPRGELSYDSLKLNFNPRARCVRVGKIGVIYMHGHMT